MTTKKEKTPIPTPMTSTEIPMSFPSGPAADFAEGFLDKLDHNKIKSLEDQVKDLKEKNPTAGYDEIYKAPQYLELQKQRDAIEKEIAPTKAKIDALKKRPEVEKLNRLQTAWTTLWRAKKEKEKAQEDKGE